MIRPHSGTAAAPHKISEMDLAFDPMTPEPYRIQEVVHESRDVFTLQLVRQNPGPQLRFAPGQFNMVSMFGIGEVPVSISSDPDHPEVLSHTIRAVGTVTRAMTKLSANDAVGLRGPYGSSWPVEAAMNNDIILVAGGIGLAPLRPALYRILTYREMYGRVYLLYGARLPDDLIFRQELEMWRSRLDLDIHVTVDRGTGEWKGNVGVVTKLMSALQVDPEKTKVMICGPEPMIRFSVLELQKNNIPKSSIFVSMERSMKCGIGFCGHCQIGPVFACKDGPVFRFDQIEHFASIREV